MELRLLGAVELWAGERQIRLGPPKQRALLAALAYSVGAPLPAATLVERVWGDDPPGRVSASLQSYVTRLRQALRQLARVNRVGDGYQLDAPANVVDLHVSRDLTRRARACAEAGEFDRAAGLTRAGLDLWRGEPLAGVPGDWADRVRAGTTGEWLTLLVLHARAELGRGRPHDVVETLARAAVEHPEAEHLTVQLMVALHRCGRTTEALDAYHRLRRHLAEQLGVEPGAEVRRLYQALLTPDPEPGPTGEVGEIVERMHRLVDRYARQEEIAERHRTELRQLLDDCLSEATKLL